MQGKQAASSERVVSEVSAKRLLQSRCGSKYAGDRDRDEATRRVAAVDGRTDWGALVEGNPWLLDAPRGLVVKLDQALKRREQLGLIQLNVNLETAKLWIQKNLGARITVDEVEITLKQFLIEPFLPHQQNEEVYLCIYSHTETHDVVLFHHEGGVDVGNVDEKALQLPIRLGETPSKEVIQDTLLKNVPTAKKQMLAEFVQYLVSCFQDLHFTLLEINPLVVTQTQIHILDVAAKLDAKAAPLCKEKWGPLRYVPPLCRDLQPEESHIAGLSANTPSSMHLTILNKAGRIWSLVSGGGTSLVINDTASALGVEDEIACYTQFSGRPTADQLYEFTKTLIDLMVEVPHPRGKSLLLSSNVVDLIAMIQLNIGAVKGVVKALQDCREKLVTHNVSLVIRRCTLMTAKTDIPAVLAELGVPIHVVYIDIPMTQILKCALGIADNAQNATTATEISDSGHQPSTDAYGSDSDCKAEEQVETDTGLFNGETRVIVIGLSSQAVQGMINFDFICGRKTPSVAARVIPSGVDKEEDFLWDEGQVTIPVYGSTEMALKEHPDASVVVSGASGLDAFPCALQAVRSKQIRCILIIAGHIPDQQTRILVQTAKNNGVLLIGPCTPFHLMQVNFIMPGSFRANNFGNVGGSLDDLVTQRLYRPGSVGLVTRSGGLSMELILNIARNTDGLYRGISLGGGKYTGSTFLDHLKSLQRNPKVKILLLLGEFGGLDEHEVCEALRSGEITKPTIAFCIGECAAKFKSQPGYFGHTGAGSDVAMETAAAKNKALAEAGAIVPRAFDEIGDKLGEVYGRLVSTGKLVPRPEPPVPSIPANMKPAKGKK